LLSRTLTSIFILVIIIELLSWILSVFIIDTAFKYILIQGFFITLVIIRVFFYENTLIWILLAKVGIVPFHSWYIILSKRLILLVLWMFITLHKVIPLLLLGVFLDNSKIILFILTNTLVLTGVFSLFGIILLSSSSHLLWRLILISISIIIALSYWVFYTLISLSYMRSTSFGILILSIFLGVIFLVITGLPPFLFFSLKFLGAYIISTKILLGLWALLLISVVRVLVYYRGFIRMVPQFSENLSIVILILIILFQCF